MDDGTLVAVVIAGERAAVAIGEDVDERIEKEITLGEHRGPHALRVRVSRGLDFARQASVQVAMYPALLDISGVVRT